MHTVESVRAVVASAWEDFTIPDSVARWARENDRKDLRSNLLSQLHGGATAWRIKKEYGMCHLETANYGKNLNAKGAAYGYSFLIAYQTTGVSISWEFIRDHNKGYFVAAAERNALRLKAMNDPLALAEMAIALNEVEKHRKTLAIAESILSDLTAKGEPFNPERSTFEKLTGGE
jgi:hypothetical protein